MPIKRLNEFPAGNGSLSNDDVFIFMDDPSGSGITKKITLSQLSSAIGGGGGGNPSIFSLGVISGSNAINFGTDRFIQTLTLNGSSTTFTKGTGWPISSTLSADVVLRITVTNATSITWSIVTDWFNQPVSGALSNGTHLFLLRAIGSSIVEGHYIGNKTN
jgi:hypothetical protein